jgi:hypothetical protein
VTRAVRAALVVAVAVAGAAGCKTVAEGKHFEGQIKAALEQRGIVVTVDCPDRIPLGKVADNKFRCEVVVPAEHSSTTIEVAMDEAGNLKWDPVGPPRPADP